MKGKKSRKSDNYIRTLPNDEDSLISPNDSLVFEIIFSPHDLMTYIDYLTIDNSDSTIYVFMQGQGIPPLDSKNAISDLPEEYALHNPFPNPFNSETTLKFDFPIDGVISLKIYDVQGRMVTQLIDSWKPAGYYQLRWSASLMASGLYLVVLEADMYKKTQKLLLIK